MENIKDGSSSPLGLSLVVAAEWLMVLPAAVILAAAALQSLGGRGLPVQIAKFILQGAGAHLARPSAAFVFLGMPGAVLVLGVAAFLRAWRTSKDLRNDVKDGLAILRRHPLTEMMAVAIFLAGGVLLFVLIHLITD